MAENPTIEELKTPLLAAVGAADLALATVNEIVVTLRERAEGARTDVGSRAEERRAKLTGRVDEARDRLVQLQEELPKEFGDLREKLTADELRRVAEGYAEQAQTTYNRLVERGEAALERLRNQPVIEDAAGRAEGYVGQAVEVTQDALGTVAAQTRAVGERAAKLVGVDLPGRVDDAVLEAEIAVEKAAKKAPAKKAPAKKTPAKKAAAAKAPAKKAPAKKVTQK
ncbi:heparin-binding hemagglutinin [[Mycobacterium] burgundiense]|uniref:Heparin-binding hemagglutinin n=1 Tax=[Mycobacterium] burgundiense TaxID=3064286 RepID=A0ABM9M274_9MYCO|nr:heparin-binding hemagglutinin [Mycolicibacterium sp. MU0053]CAJ1508944.1 heparin-binding hemagglutinin [Mycolicibacterium sp. MU0053]